MIDRDQGNDLGDNTNQKIPLENCPHCNRKLSPWEQVLLKVDGALICKKCWYRILLKDAVVNL
jgi:DNA-directed RNA polymerase subunit RPC12/RpoP